jgi:hypothetical protein
VFSWRTSLLTVSAPKDLRGDQALTRSWDAIDANRLSFVHSREPDSSVEGEQMHVDPAQSPAMPTALGAAHAGTTVLRLDF